ncbi:xanthine dehydrogenase family protein molybdopterin-binding subunit [Metallosphaera sp.]|uniref:xanthine dehydrogenase family protein molybdopterin-binding subunit n=2 Tax=Metallosphaera sp. TaxID=2020860 RepID=UPI003862121A
MLKEHYPIVVGKSLYIDDITPSNTAYLHVVRSPIARGVIKSVSGPEKALLTFTWEQIRNWMPVRLFGPSEGFQVARMPVLANGRVNFVGQPVMAFVVQDRYEGEDLADDVSLDYEELNAVTDPESALESEPIHPELKSNIFMDQLLQGGNLSLKDKADVVVRRKIKQSRVATNPMEPKGILCWWDGDTLNVKVSTQAPFGVRNDLHELLGIPPEKIKVSSPPNVGGGFGNKSGGYPEYVLAALASLKLGRPVKWIETRSEILNNTQSQGRGEVSDMKLYATRSGEMLGMEGEVIANMGAYAYGINYFTSQFVARLSNGPYKLKFASVRAITVYTNTPPMGFYRGAGRPEAALIHETLVEDLAEELGMDPVEIRRRNLVDDSGYVTPLGLRYDAAGYREVFDRAANYYRKLRETSKGVSLVTFTEIVRTSPGESARIEVKDGKVIVHLGLGAHGQAYESSFRTVVAEELGIDPEKVEVRTGDSEGVKEGIGSFGSRGGTIGSSAALAAAQELKRKLGGRVDLSREMTVEVFYRAEDIFAPGAHVAKVELDHETGIFRVVEYYAVDDVGRVLNHEEIEGQIIGGVLQGVSQVMMEAVKFDERGNPMCSSVADCGMLTAVEGPRREPGAR